MRYDYRNYQRYGYLIYVGALALLLLVFFPGMGRTVNGAQRWVSFGFVTFQPSELAKLAMILFFAAFLAKKEKEGKLKDLSVGYLPCLVALGIMCTFIQIQPDLGTAVIIASVSLFMFAVAGIRMSHLTCTALLAAPFLVATVYNVGYRRKRIMSFLDPWEDASDTGYQIIQSFVAISRGGVTGSGLGAGQQKLFFLPEPHTDFIFSIIGEELGLLGGFAVIILFALLAWRGFRVGMNAPDRFGALLALGVTFCITLQAAVNISVTMGALPTKGLPLPFISLGGSALVMWMISVGILLNVSEHTN